MRYALGVEYDGSEFLGWQQLGEMGPSVQATLQQALASVADASVRVVCAGRYGCWGPWPVPGCAF